MYKVPKSHSNINSDRYTTSNSKSLKVKTTSMPNSSSISRQIETDHQQAFFASPPGYAVIGVVSFIVVLGGVLAAVTIIIRRKKSMGSNVLEQSLWTDASF